MNPGELRAFLHLMDEVMAGEDVPAGTRKRIINTMIFGNPEGYSAREEDREATESFLTAPGFPGAFQPQLPHEITPARSAVWYGGDGREIDFLTWGPTVLELPEESYPVTSTCECGRMIIQEGRGAQWEHCD